MFELVAFESEMVCVASLNKVSEVTQCSKKYKISDQSDGVNLQLRSLVFVAHFARLRLTCLSLANRRFRLFCIASRRAEFLAKPECNE